MTPPQRFHYSRNVKTNQALPALVALAQESRLAVFRLLVQAGPAGLAAGDIASRLDIPPATLSFHLKTLAHGGLVVAKQEGRFVIYSADFGTMNALVGFLTENCCGGDPALCAPAESRVPAPKRRSAS